jgi:dethiobiotin synthetase
MMNYEGFFVTGTDTEVGKTLVAAAIILKLQSIGLKTTGYKPVVAGMHEVDGNLINEDIENLLKVSRIDFPELKASDICSYFLKDAAAPHLVAVKEGMTLDKAVMIEQYKLLQNKTDAIVVEGAGGFLVPINEHLTLGDFAKEIQLPVILVVDIKLGCINHALLTAEVIKNRGLRLFAWVANSTQPETEYTHQNIETLKTLLFKKYQAYLLGRVPFLNAISNQGIYNMELLINTSKTLTLNK